MAKELQLLELIHALDIERRGWSIVDEWEADLMAVGFTSRSFPDRIFYLSIFDQSPGTAYYSCDVRTKGMTDITTVREGTAGYDDVAEIIEEFLETKTLRVDGRQD